MCKISFSHRQQGIAMRQENIAGSLQTIVSGKLYQAVFSIAHSFVLEGRTERSLKHKTVQQAECLPRIAKDISKWVKSFVGCRRKGEKSINTNSYSNSYPRVF